MSIRFGFPFFKRVLISRCLASSWLVFWEIETHSRTRDGCHVSTLWSGRDNFIGIRVDGFQNLYFIFTSPVDIGLLFFISCIICLWIWTSISFYKQNEHSTIKKTRPTTKGTYKRGGCLNTICSFSTRRATGLTRIPSLVDAITRLLSTHNPRGILGIHELLVCSDSSSS